MNELIASAAAGRAPARSNRRRLQDLIRPAQLAVLALELLDALSLGGAHARPRTAIDLGLANPLAQRLVRHPQLARDRRDRRPLRLVLGLVLEHHPHRTLPDLR